MRANQEFLSISLDTIQRWAGKEFGGKLSTEELERVRRLFIDGEQQLGPYLCQGLRMVRRKMCALNERLYHPTDILYALTVEDIQVYAEGNRDRTLTDAELQRVDDEFCEADPYDIIDAALDRANIAESDDDEVSEMVELKTPGGGIMHIPRNAPQEFIDFLMGKDGPHMRELQRLWGKRQTQLERVQAQAYGFGGKED